MDLLVDNLQWKIGMRLDFEDFMKSRKFFEKVVAEDIYEHYHKSAMVIQNNILRKRILKNNNLCWITKFNYHNINGKMLYFIIKYDTTFARSETIIPKMNLEDTCHRCCPQCHHYYPTLFCLLICRRYCGCKDCIEFIKEKLVGRYVIKVISSNFAFV